MNATSKPKSKTAAKKSLIEQSVDKQQSNGSQPANRQYSGIVVDGPERAASRAMLHAVGFTAEDFKKSQVGIASLWSMVTPCNMHINQLADQAAAGVDGA